ncbi:MAG TPA: amidohydrolase [Pyrinomonadaceae bacterium]|jgi:predicted amidohydrolase YtcJ|nr:amidohydrolase [Pyrinomonadaceae bacterium]
MKSLRAALALSLVALVLLAADPSRAFVAGTSPLLSQKRRVSLVLTNGKIFTADARGTMAEAVAVEGERIVAVGTSAQVGRDYTAARTIDLRGRLVTPGFNDAHIHFIGGGRSLLLVELVGARTLEEAKGRVAAKVKELPQGAWVLGRGWDHTLWGGQWPTRSDLDAVAPNNPVFLQRVDGHVSWANSLALKQAGVTRETTAPAGGEILHDAQGEPTGILKETAAGLVARVVPQPSRAERMQAAERALAEARRYGITSIQDNSGYESIELYRELLQAGKLTVRVAEWQNFEDTIEKLKQQRAEFASFKIDPLRIRLSALKGYVDGTLGSRTAAMLAPFADDPHNSGIPRRPPEVLTRMIVERDAAGFQIALHAIGDRANRMALDGFEAASKANGSPIGLGERIKVGQVGVTGGTVAGAKAAPAKEVRPSDFPVNPDLKVGFTIRHRIEHSQVVAPADFARFRDLGVIASMQPSHAISDKRWAQDRLGEYRVQGAYAWHKMRAHGVHTPFGTDWPVEPVNPYLGLYAAVTRQSTEGDPAGGWWPQERLSIAEAIRCYTAESAYASFEENEKGQIAPGMLADFVVHTRDLLTIKPEEILQTEAAITILGGRVVYEK